MGKVSLILSSFEKNGRSRRMNVMSRLQAKRLEERKGYPSSTREPVARLAALPYLKGT